MPLETSVPDEFDPATRLTQSDPRTYDEMLEDPFLADGWERRQLQGEAALGHAAVVLVRRGDQETARLLLDVIKVAVEQDRDGEWDLWLEVAPEHRDQFSDEVAQKIREVCVEVSSRRGYGIDWVCVREVLPEVGPQWREQLQQQLSGGKRPTNQARRVRTEPPRYVEDWLQFTNAGELTVYRALRQIQENDLLPEETIGIYPLAGGRVRSKTWEPDVLVTYKGRAGVLEVDGPTHNARRAMDISRDHVLLDSGVAFVDRVPVEALNDPSELTAILRRFLRRLGEAR